MVQEMRKKSETKRELLDVLDMVEKGMLLIHSDSPDIRRSTDGTEIATSSDSLNVTQQAGHGRRRSVGNIARDLGSTSPSSQE